MLDIVIDVTIGAQLTWWSSKSKIAWGPLGIVASAGIMGSFIWFKQTHEAYTTAGGWKDVDETFTGDHPFFVMASLGLVSATRGREVWVPIFGEVWIDGGGKVFFSAGTAIYF